MDRRIFLKQSCIACVGAIAFGALATACKSVHYVAGTLGKDGITLPLSEFLLKNGSYRSYIILRDEALQYPVCVYRFGENDYSALWMQCPHQGAELQAAGDRLTCPAHGSEFDNKGIVQQGPAPSSLRRFPVFVTGDQLFIDLRKQA